MEDHWESIIETLFRFFILFPIFVAINQIVASTTYVQSLKGIFTAGSRQSLVYGWRKIRKRFQG